jgi:hypothetical protein
MKSVFDASVRAELASRIHLLSLQSNAQWGKMNAYQMIKHCTLCEDMMLGKTKIKRVLIGRLIGGIILKKVLKDNTPFGKNSPTSPLLKTTTKSGDIEQQKKEWVSRLEEYARYDDPEFVHPFFGPMTKEQIGCFAYKHADHHLRQFGA